MNRLSDRELDELVPRKSPLSVTVRCRAGPLITITITITTMLKYRP